MKGFQRFQILKRQGDLLKEIGGNVHFENGEMVVDPTSMISMPLPNGKVKSFARHII